MRIGLAKGNQLLVAPVYVRYVTGFSRTEFSKEPAMNGTSGFQEVQSSTTRSSTNRLLREQRHRFGTGPGTFSATHED